MRPLKRPIENPKKEVAIDTESVNWSHITAACAVASDGTTIQEKNLPNLVRSLRKSGLLNENVRHWAHAGGIHDFLLILPWALDNGWQVSRAVISGGSLIALDLVCGELFWRLRDSYRLFPDSLKKVGIAYGVHKIDVDRTAMETLSEADTLDYCTQDCRVLLHAVLDLRGVISNEGGGLGDTLASTAAGIARQLLPKDAYGWDRHTDSIAALAYYGGRTERFTGESAHGVEHDINSAYPAAMRGDMPTRYVGGFSSFPTHLSRTNHKFIVNARVKVPDIFAGPLPVRPLKGALKGRLVYPVGTFSGWWTYDELLNAAHHIRGFEFVCDEVHAWYSEPWLSDIMNRWYKFKSESEGAKKYSYKILMNALYGKFIEQSQVVTLTQDAAKARECELKGGSYTELRAGQVSFFALTEQRTGALRHAALAAHVTQHARSKVYALITCASRTDYCDTDSHMGVATPETGKELGQWAKKSEYARAEFLAPKLYALYENEHTLTTVRAKGFPKVDDKTQYWETIKSGKPLEGDRVRLFKSAINEGEVDYKRRKVVKQRRSNTDKRCFVNNDSRPWRFDELEKLRNK